MSRVRPVVLGVFLHKGKMLVYRDVDKTTEEVFFRPLGGTIEFYEKSEDALRREIKEELGAGIENLEFLGVIESLFTYQGEKGHEIDLVYKAKFSPPELYEKDEVEVGEEDRKLTALWIPLERFEEELDLYPLGLLDLIP